MPPLPCHHATFATFYTSPSKTFLLFFLPKIINHTVQERVTNYYNNTKTQVTYKPLPLTRYYVGKNICVGKKVGSLVDQFEKNLHQDLKKDKAPSRPKKDAALDLLALGDSRITLHDVDERLPAGDRSSTLSLDRKGQR